MKKLKKLIPCLALLYLTAFMIMFPRTSLSRATDALVLCQRSVIPALFPFLVCSSYLSASGLATRLGRFLSPIMQPLFGVSGSGALAWILGTACGYPVGAACIANLYASGECTREEGERMLSFCNNSGPLFIVSVIGCAYLKTPTLGYIIYISHTLASVLTGMFFKIFARPHKGQKHLPPKLRPSPKETLLTLGGAIDSAVLTTLKICGFVIIFAIASASLPKSQLTPYIHSLLEITGGLKSLSALQINPSLKLSLISFFCAFSGLSVILQVASIVKPLNFSLKPFLWGKLLQGVLSASITKILTSRMTLSAFSPQTKTPASPLWEYGGWFSSFVMLAFGFATLFILISVSKKLCRRKHPSGF